MRRMMLAKFLFLVMNALPIYSFRMPPELSTARQVPPLVFAWPQAIRNYQFHLWPCGAFYPAAFARRCAALRPRATLRCREDLSAARFAARAGTTRQSAA